MSDAQARKRDEQDEAGSATAATERANPPADSPRSTHAESVRQLIQRKTEILSRRDTARANLEEQVMTSPGDDADLSVIDVSADYFSRLAAHHQRELIEIDQALERIHRGTYGECESCGERIGGGRLKNLPYARLCIECQAAEEKGRSAAGPQVKPEL